MPIWKGAIPKENATNDSKIDATIQTTLENKLKILFAPILRKKPKKAKKQEVWTFFRTRTIIRILLRDNG